ncbi:MAG: SurA N-terminal domain-containing protein [Simkaniaceae bacterium]|nr:SurA N-terminal domain-containing protein [Simkaniaceae bacterium]
MKLKNLIIIPLFFASLCAFDPSQDQQTSLISKQKLVINNRPLIRVNGKIISLIDVVKRMDVNIHEYFPQAKENVVAQYQYYMHQWKATLEELVTNELMLADAEEREIKVNDAEIRQEMDKRFGPNIIANIDKIGLSFEEVRSLIYSDIVGKRMLGYNVFSRAMQNVRPEQIKDAYTGYLLKNPEKSEWEYDVLTIRGNDPKYCEKVAKQASALISEKALSFTSLASDLEKEYKGKNLKIVASKDYTVDDKTISLGHKQVLEGLKEGEYSPAVAQASRTAGEDVYRIFHLKSHKTIVPNVFQEMYGKLRDELFGVEAMKLRKEYTASLKTKFGITDEEMEKAITSDYEPFSLR